MAEIKKIVTLDKFEKYTNLMKQFVTKRIDNVQVEMVLKDTLEEGLEWLEANGDKERKYALPDGYVYAYMTKEITYEKPNCNNLLVVDECTDGCRISSNGTIKDDTPNYCFSNFFEVTPGTSHTFRSYNSGGMHNIAEFSAIPNAVTVGSIPNTFIRQKVTSELTCTWEDPKGLTRTTTWEVSANTKYVAIGLYVTKAGLQTNGSIITVDEPVVLGTQTVTETVTGWFNTRQSYNSQVSEERVIALEDSVELLMNSASGDALVLPDYWKDHMAARVKAIREKMAAVGRNKSAFFFYSDAHWTSNAKKSPLLLKYLYKNTPINKTNYGGDIVATEAYDYATMAYLFDSWRLAIRDLPNHHSVAGNHDDRNEKGHDHEFTIENVYSFLLAPEECNDRVDGEGLYYYIDDKVEKTRYIYTDTACYDAYNLSVAQAQFIVDSLKSTPDNWHIIIIGHAWYNQKYTEGSPIVEADGLTTTTSKIVALASAYNSHSVGLLSELYKNDTEGHVGSVSYDFETTKAKVEFCLGGHLHNDRHNMFSDIPVIIVEADTMHNRNGSVATAGTISEQSVSAVIVDYKNNEVNFIRVGRGDSYKINLGTGEKTILTIDPLPEIKNFLDDAGYETGIRLNSSGTTTARTTNDRWVTGFIPVTTGETIYFKNIEMLNDDYGSIVAHYYEDQSPKSGGSYLLSAAKNSITYAEDGVTVASYTMSLADVKWLRFCFVKIDENSKITKQPV